LHSLRTRGLPLAFLIVLGVTAPMAVAQDPTAETTAATTTAAEPTTAVAEPTETTEPTETPSEPDAAVAEPSVSVVDLEAVRARIARHRHAARYLRRVMGKPRPRISVSAGSFETRAEYLVAKARAWRRKAQNARQRYRHPPHRAEWRCIHRHEGRWDDPNAPYYGGLQMDLAFQRQYGRFLLHREGTADHWRPREQMWVAEQALRAGRGFYPWPLTARRCGLV
jgi:hypothetical protein